MNDDGQKILLVDDDEEIRRLLAKFLGQHNYQVSVARDGTQMRQQLAKTAFNLVILDLMLPGEDGLSLCRELRAQSNIPMIMLTACDEETDRVVGLELGADDYLGKPFNPRELLARIRAVLRRAQHTVSDIKEKGLNYHFAEWQLSTVTRQLFSPEQMEISISAGEYNLLLAFLERPQRVLNRDQLLDITKNRSAAPYDRSIDIIISRLRQKIEADPKKPQLLKTIRGGGYMLTTPVTEKIT